MTYNDNRYTQPLRDFDTELLRRIRNAADTFNTLISDAQRLGLEVQFEILAPAGVVQLTTPHLYRLFEPLTDDTAEVAASVSTLSQLEHQ